MAEDVHRIRALEEQFRAAYMESYYHIHQNPELGDQEVETAAYVTEKLRMLPFDNICTGVGGGHGVTALLKGGAPGPVIAMRADMDALEVNENTGVPFASTRPGVMHACGHDAHTAMQLGVAHVLCAMKDELPGTIKFIFQPAEEKSPHGGARYMIEAGVLENPHVDAIMGMHLRPYYTTGLIAVQDGILSACSDRLKIKVIGKSAHAAMPHYGTDAIVAASAVVGALQAIISRNVNPDDAAVITIGMMQGGTRYNVIPEEVIIEGTVRTFNSAVTKKMSEWITRTAQNTAVAYGATAEVSYISGYPSMHNEPVVSQICRESVVETFGSEALLPPQGRDPGGEDFAFFSQKIPAAYAFIGCSPKGVVAQEQPALHSAKFLPDPGALSVGVTYAASAALRLLSNYEPKSE